MPEPYKRSRSLRRIKITTPSGKHVIHYEKRKPSIAKCGECGKELAGVPRAGPREMKRLAKTERRPQRPYGGNLCTACMRKQMVFKAKNIKL